MGYYLCLICGVMIGALILSVTALNYALSVRQVNLSKPLKICVDFVRAFFLLASMPATLLPLFLFKAAHDDFTCTGLVVIFAFLTVYWGRGLYIFKGENGQVITNVFREGWGLKALPSDKK